MTDYHIQWDAPSKHIIRVTPLHPLTWERFQAGAEEVAVMMGSVSHTVHIIIDTSVEGKPLPAGGVKDNFEQMFARLPNNHGLCILVGATPWLTVTVQVFLKATGRVAARNLYFVSTLEDAYLLLQHRQDNAHT